MIPPRSADIVERYEVLRAQLLRGHWSQAQSWQVVVQHGLLAWCQLPLSRPFPLPPPPPCRGGMPADLQAPVTHVLANMVLRLHQEVAHVN